MRIKRQLAWLALSVALLAANPAFASPVNIYYSVRGVHLKIERFEDISVELANISSDLGPYSEFFRVDLDLASVSVDSFVSLDSFVTPNGIFASGSADSFIDIHYPEASLTSSVVTTLIEVGIEVLEPVPFELAANVFGAYTSDPPWLLLSEVRLDGPDGFYVGVVVREGTQSLAENGILEPGVYNLHAGAVVSSHAFLSDESPGGSTSFAMSLIVPEVSTGMYLVFLIGVTLLPRWPSTPHA